MRIKQLINNTKDVFKTSRLDASQRKDRHHNFAKFVMVSAVVAVALEPSLAMATSTVGTVTNSKNFQDMIQSVIAFMTGTIAKSVAVLAVVFLGFMAMAGKLAWDVAGKVILGIILIFSATQIVELFVK